jgi:hypothetical protein
VDRSRATKGLERVQRRKVGGRRIGDVVRIMLSREAWWGVKRCFGGSMGLFDIAIDVFERRDGHYSLRPRIVQSQVFGQGGEPWCFRKK